MCIVYKNIPLQMRKSQGFAIIDAGSFKNKSKIRCAHWPPSTTTKEIWKN